MTANMQDLADYVADADMDSKAQKYVMTMSTGERDTIVTTLRAHDDMLDALREAVRLYESYGLIANVRNGSDKFAPGRWINKARDTVTKAERKSDMKPATENDIPKATHEGKMTIYGIELRTYVLDDGRAVIHADDFQKLLHFIETGKVT